MILSATDSKIVFILSGILSNLKEGFDYERLNKIPVLDHAPKAMIGAGTGLGFGILMKNKNSIYYEVLPSEGGGQDFGPKSEIEWQYKKYLPYNDGKNTPD